MRVYYSRVGGTSKKLAENINAEVKKLMSSRGIKTKIGDGGRDYFGIIRDTDAPAVLCEGGFVDSKKDADYIKSNYRKLTETYSIGGSLGGILVSSKLTAYRLQQLESRVADHNNFTRRMPVIEEQIKVTKLCRIE